MEAKELLNDIHKEQERLENSETIELTKKALIDNKILTEEEVNQLSDEKIINLATQFCENEYKKIQQRDIVQSELAGMRSIYLKVEHYAKIYQNKEYVILKGETFPKTSKIAQRNYIRFDTVMPFSIVNEKGDSEDINYIYIAVTNGHVTKTLSEYGEYILGRIQEVNGTFMEAVLEKMFDMNQQEFLLLAPSGVPIGHIYHLLNMFSGDLDIFFSEFLAFTRKQACGELIMKKALERKSKK